ncbi:hypothetical protein HanRHA438_Chr09g0376911 [Helianthus annuus]|nr:hypothetical protein HanRHA438_Chr09g0376911 [Helianthus annuus]
MLLIVEVDQHLGSIILGGPELLLKISYLEILQYSNLLKVSNLAILILDVANICLYLSKFLQGRQRITSEPSDPQN